MAVTFTSSNSTVSAKATDIITSAATEVGVLGQGDTLSGGDQAWILEKLQRLIDRFNANRKNIFSENFTSFTITANHNPHTIGPGGDWVMNTPPVKIFSAALVLTNSSIDLPLWMMDAAEWAREPLKSLTSSLPTKIYYERDFPLGQVNLWPQPTVTNNVRLGTWQNLTQAVSTSTALAMPPSYWDVIVLTLARDFAPSFGKDAIVRAEALSGTLREAMRTLEGNNADPPRISTDVPNVHVSNVRPGFNFLTGKPW